MVGLVVVIERAGGEDGGEGGGGRIGGGNWEWCQLPFQYLVHYACSFC